MKVSKVKSVQGNGTWDSQYGLLYKFEYHMEDGATVNAMHKGNTPLAVGTPVEYNITNAQFNSGKVHKYTEQAPQQAAAPQQTGGRPDPSNAILYQTCLKGCFDYFNACGEPELFTPQNVNNLAYLMAKEAKQNIDKLNNQ